MSAFGFGQELHQKQTQSLVLAPQLRQSLKILQVAALDLRSVIQEELENNPALEEMPLDGVSLEHETDEAAHDAENRDRDGNHDSRSESDESGGREEMDFSK